MTRDLARCDPRIGCCQSPQDRRQHCILTFIIRRFIFTFELNSDGKIIATCATAETRLSGMPGALGKRDELNELTVTPDQ